MKQLYAALCGFLMHTSLVAGNHDQLSYAHYAQRPRNPIDELIAIQQLSNQGAYNDAHNQYLTFLNHRYNDAIITSQTSIGYLHNLAHLLESSPTIKDSEKAYTQALQLFENLNDQLKPHVYKAIGTIYQHLSAPERRHFIQQFHTGITYAPMFNAYGEPTLSFDLCKNYIKKEQPSNAFDITTRLGLGSSYLQLLHTQNSKPKDLKMVEEKLSELCILRKHEKIHDVELTNIHIHTWHMLAEISAKTETYRNAVHCWINSLYEYYNQYGHINVHVLDPKQISAFASCIRNHADCLSCLHDLSKELDHQSQPEFLHALFSYASAYSSDGAWLLEQYEMTSRFSSLWHTYTHRPDETSKQDLQDIIKTCMHDQEKRNYLLHACTESEQKRFIWETIFNQAKDALRYEAALQQAKLTDNIQKKALLLNLAVTQNVPQASELAFNFCKEVGCSNQTAALCKSIITHTPDKSMDMIAWLEQMNDNDHASELLKVLADKGYVHAQFSYGSLCQKRYKKDRQNPEAQSWKKLATTYLTKAQQNKKLDTKARLKLAYFACKESDITQLEELVGALAHGGNHKAQRYFARAYHTKTCTAAFDSTHAIESAKQLANQQNKHKIKQVHTILKDRDHTIQWFNKAIQNTSNITKKLDLQCDLATFHLNLADIYTNHAVAQKSHAVCLQGAAKQFCADAEKAANDVLMVHAKHARTHALLGILHQQAGNFEKATPSLIKAYNYDPSPELADVLMSLCNTMVEKTNGLGQDQLVSRMATSQLSQKLFDLFAKQQIALSNEDDAISISKNRIKKLISDAYKKEREMLINLIRKTIPQSEELISSFEKDYEISIPKIIEEVSKLFVQTTGNLRAMTPMHAADLARNVVQEIIHNALDKDAVCISLASLSEQQIVSIAQIWHKAREDVSSKEAEIIAMIKHTKDLTDALLALNPDNANALNLKGICEKYQNSKKSKKRAIQYFTKSAQNGSIDALFNLANLYRDITNNEEKPVCSSAYIIADQTEDKGKLKLAEETYKKVLAQDPTYKAAWYNLSLVQLGQGNDRESFSSCHEAAKLHEAKAYYRLAECLLGGYGGRHDISLAIENLHIAKALFNLNKQHDMAHRSEMLAEIANYQASNYIQNYVNTHIQKFFPEQKNLTKAIIEATSSIGQWIHAQANPDIKGMAQESHVLLQKALHEQSIAGKKELYQVAKKLFMQVLGIDEFDAAQHRLEQYTDPKHPLSIRQEAFAAKGLLHFHQSKAAINPELKKKHQKFALKYLEQLHAYDVYHYNSARQLFQHITATLEATHGLHQPEQLNSEQKKSLEMVLKELDFVIHDLIAFQPHNYFVGRALAHAAFIQKQNDNILKARQLLQLGHDNNHLICSLQLARGYESNSLIPTLHDLGLNSEDEQAISNLLKTGFSYKFSMHPSSLDLLYAAKKILAEALQQSDPHDPYYQHAVNDLLILQQKLGIAPSDPHALQFLEKFNLLAQQKQKQKYEECEAFFTSWQDLVLIDRQEFLALATTILDEQHKYFGMQKTLLKLFPRIEKLSTQKQYETVRNAYLEWNSHSQEERMELKIMTLTCEERDVIYADMKQL